MEIDLIVNDPVWNTLGIDEIANRACGAVLDHLKIEQDLIEISVLATNDTEIAELNSDFRDKPKATNVLSWPAEDLSPATSGAAPELPLPGFDGMIALGDIAISYDTCRAEAAAGDIPLHDHLTHLMVHGTLHLLGYDHTKDADAALMERIEIEILGKMGIDNPYSDKAAADPQ